MLDRAVKSVVTEREKNDIKLCVNLGKLESKKTYTSKIIFVEMQIIYCLKFVYSHSNILAQTLNNENAKFAAYC